MSRTISLKRIGIVVGIIIASVETYYIGLLIFPYQSSDVYDISVFERIMTGLFVEFACSIVILFLYALPKIIIPGIFNFFFPKKGDKDE